ncbi:MAG TPA: hypothetical protein PLR02_04005 [Rhodocyclaceae bacterium]|nr:hypothetical protein [Rhodocyclaceae bacterium]
MMAAAGGGLDLPDTPDYVPPWALKFREWGIKQFSGIEADHEERRATFTAIFTKHAEMRAFWEAVPDSISERDGLGLFSVFVFGVDRRIHRGKIPVRQAQKIIYAACKQPGRNRFPKADQASSDIG